MCNKFFITVQEIFKKVKDLASLSKSDSEEDEFEETVADLEN